MALFGATAVSVYSTAALAQDSNAVVLPGQPFQGAQPSAPAAGGDVVDNENSGMGGHYTAQANLLRTYTSNMYYAPDGVSKVRAWGWALQPNLKYTNDLPRLQLIGSVDGTLASYNTPGQHDDYADGKFSLGAHWAPLRLDHINLDASYSLSHDPFGTSRTEGFAGVAGSTATTSPDKWNLANVSLDWTHGASIQGLAFETKFNYTDKTYVNNKVQTQFEDYDAYSGEGVVFYAITPKTQVLVDGIVTRSQQPNTVPGFASQDAIEYEGRVGARWYATAKTFGDFRVGMMHHEFDHNSQPSFTGMNWTASVNWAAKPYRIFSLETGQRSDPSYVSQAGFIDTRYAQLQWAEDWTTRFYTRLVADYVHSGFVNASRDDDNYFGAVFVNYMLARDLTVFGIGAFGRRKSDDNTFDYSRADAFVGIKYVFFNNL
jgi:hypothetical protein